MPRQAGTTRPAARRSRDSSPCSSDSGRSQAREGAHAEHDGLAKVAQPPATVGEAARELGEVIASGGPAVLLCDGDLDGVLCAVGCLFLARAQGVGVRVERAEGQQPRIGDRCVECTAEADDARAAFAMRVFRGYAAAVGLHGSHGRSGTLSRSQSTLLRHLALACASDEPTMPQTVSDYLLMGFSDGPVSRELISDPRVAALDGLVRYSTNECEHVRQFLRFSAMGDGSFGASFRPSADVLPFVGAHFASRMRGERFYVVDPTHGTVLLHEEGAGACAVVSVDSPTATRIADPTGIAEDERYVRAMWKRFYDGMALQGRGKAERGYDLRAHWMRKRFWERLTELDPRSDDPGDSVPARYSG